MSQGIWTRCVGDSEPPWRRLAFAPFRVVESQTRISTRKLVDGDEEQALLEEMIDGVKPPVPAGMRKLHYLLSTPFRHPPLKHGSRFGSADERSLFYASKSLETAFAEMAYYRFVFLAGTRAKLTPLTALLSSFRVHIKTRRGLDLTAPPFRRFAEELTSRQRTTATQELGRAMRAAQVEAFVYASARDPRGGHNVALFTACFSPARPFEVRNWASTTDDRRVEIVEHDLLSRTRKVMAFERTVFEVGGELPAPFG